MNTVELSDVTIQGDVWKQLVNISMTDQDFTGITSECTLYAGKTLVEGTVPTSVPTAGALGSASVVITIEGAQTALLAPGPYTVRLRIETLSWGPYTILAMNFTIAK